MPSFKSVFFFLPEYWCNWGKQGAEKKQVVKEYMGARGEGNQAQQVVGMGSGEGAGLAAPNTSSIHLTAEPGAHPAVSRRLSVALLSVVAGD